jgi:hypothetical protein
MRPYLTILEKGMNRIQQKVLKAKLRERYRTLQQRHMQPVVNKILRDSLEQTTPESLVVPKTSLVETEMSLPPEEKNEGSTKLPKERKLGPTKPHKKSKVLKAS